MISISKSFTRFWKSPQGSVQPDLLDGALWELDEIAPKYSKLLARKNAK